MSRLLNYPAASGTALPANRTPLEDKLDRIEGDRLHGTVPDQAGTGGLARTVPLLWDAERCPLEWLPLLAWAFRLDFFDTAWPERFQREMVINARRINELRGTVDGLKLMLELLGHPNAEIKERIRGRIRGDGTTRGDGYQRGSRGSWATFQVRLTNPISDRQREILLQALDRVKRNCCHLLEFNTSTAPLLRGLGHQRGQGKVRGTI